jgi:hypothetical protein
MHHKKERGAGGGRQTAVTRTQRGRDTAQDDKRRERERDYEDNFSNKQSMA